MKIRVDGLRELQSKIRKIEDKDLRSELRAANKSAAEIVADQAERCRHLRDITNPNRR